MTSLDKKRRQPEYITHLQLTAEDLQSAAASQSEFIDNGGSGSGSGDDTDDTEDLPDDDEDRDPSKDYEGKIAPVLWDIKQKP